MDDELVVVVQTSSILLRLLPEGIPVNPPSPATGHEFQRDGKDRYRRRKRKEW
jgi:hypothetical protein